MKLRLDDRELFGNDAGEDERPEVLVSYFVDQPAFDRFRNRKVRLCIARARKGMGKSALLYRFRQDLLNAQDREPPVVVKETPASLAALKEAPATDNPIVLENYWKQVICAAINVRLAKLINFAWTDNQLALVETAEIAGYKDRNLLGALAARMLGKISLGSVEIKPTPLATPNHAELLQRYVNVDGLDREVWFLLDDVDAAFQSTPAGKAFVASFFSACRTLINDTVGIGIRATVRSDVWSTLSRTEHLDKVLQYLVDIKWSELEQKHILSNRILGYIKRTQPDSDVAGTWNFRDNADPLIAMAFSRRLPWGEDFVQPNVVLSRLTAGRPRWMGQLCRMAGEHAAREEERNGVGKTILIGMGQLNQSLVEFGRERLADLYKEHDHQFAQLQQVVESFSGGPRQYTTAELRQHLRNRYVDRVGVERVPPIDGMPFKSELQLARLLYSCGFINGYNKNRTVVYPNYVSFEARPDLLEVESNLDDGMPWELQPAYRHHLRIK